MSRWIFLFSAAFLALLSSLTVAKSPDWANWKWSVLAGEYGHWLALGSMALAGAGWRWHGKGGPVTVVTLVLCLLAFGLYCVPSFGAAAVARTLPADLARQFGPVPRQGVPFSFLRLFARPPAAIPHPTLTFAGPLALDFYPALRPPGKSPPCVIVVHGGGWDSGDRGQIPQLNFWLGRHGYAVAAISYRLAPAAIWPAQRTDLLAAIAFLREEAPALGIDPTRLILLGRSAGGQIVEAVGYGAKDPAIRGVVGLYAPSDLDFGYAHAREDDVLRSPQLMRNFLGGTPAADPAAYASASGLNFVGPDSPPTLLVHGQLDTLVWDRHSERLAARLAQVGVPCVFLSLPWATHAIEYNLQGPGGQLTTFALEWYLAAVTR